MLDKSTGAVGCFHCQTLGAGEICAICNRPVCPRCAAADTCPVPHRRELRLGLGRRLRSVSPDGACGVVSSWNGGMTVVDLHRGQRLASLGFIKFAIGYGPWPELVSAQQVVSASVTLSRSPYMLVGAPGDRMVQLDLPPAQSSSEKLHMERLAISEDGARAAVARSDMLVDLVDLTRPALRGTISEPSAEIQSMALSRELDLLVLGLYGRFKIFRLSDHMPLDVLSPQKLDGDVAWLGFSRGRLAMVSVNGHCLVLQVTRGRAPDHWTTVTELSLESSSTLADIVGEMPRGARRVVASISDDGELLAVRQGKKQVEVYPLSGGAPVMLEGHTDRVNLVRFVAGGRQLITADCDNRVGFWPRSVITTARETGT